MTGPPAGSQMPLTWSDRGDDVRRPLDRATAIREARGYLLSLGSVAVAIAVTRYTWPFFSHTPFIVLFGATFVGARFATELSSMVGIGAAAFGTAWIAPPGTPHDWGDQTVIAFLIGSFVVNRVVVSRNRAVDALETSEGQFRAAWDNSAFGAALLDERGMVERINPAMERTLGFASGSWRGVSFAHFVVPDEMREARTRFASFMSAEAESYERETRFRRFDGSTIWGRVTMSVVHGAGGARIGALMVVEDVSRRRTAEDDLRASEARFRTLFDEVPVGLFQSNVDGRIVMANRALLRMLGQSSIDGLRDTRLTDLIATREGQATLDDTMRGGRNVRSLLAPLTCRDHVMMVTIEMRAVRNAAGTVTHYDGTVVEAPKGSVAVAATGM